MPKSKDEIDGEGIMAKKKKKSKSRSEKAGLILPISKVNRRMRATGWNKRVGSGAPVYLAAVLEYAASEILELAGADLGKRKRITPQDIMKAIRSDEELNQLTAGFVIFMNDRVKNVSNAVMFKPKPREIED